MPRSNFLISFVLAVTLLGMQTGIIFAAPATQETDPIGGTVQAVMLETDTNTAITTVTVTVVDKNELFHSVRISLRTALALGLITLDGEGKPGINNSMLGQSIEFDPALLIPEGAVNRHPVGNVLATLFSNLPGIDYDTIMAAHKKGTGFRVIAEVLWLTAKLGAGFEVFQAILEARQSGDYTAFLLEDGTVLKNWGQLRKAILDMGKKGNPGIIMSGRDETNGEGTDNANSDENGSDHGNNQEKNKEKDKAKNNSGNGNGVGEASSNDQGKDKEKDNHGNGNDKK